MIEPTIPIAPDEAGRGLMPSGFDWQAGEAAFHSEDAAERIVSDGGAGLSPGQQGTT
jgi:hypothetical protein